MEYFFYPLRIWDGLGPMHAHQRLSLLMMSKPHMAEDVYGTAWVIQSGPCLPRQLKAYSGRDQKTALSKLSFPDSVIDLILDYGCTVNDYLLVLSTPSQYNFEVWAMWSDFDDISEALSVGVYKRRFLGLWNYKDLISLFRTGLSLKLCSHRVDPWIEVEVQSNDNGERGGWVSMRDHRDTFIHLHISEAVAFAWVQPLRRGKWLIDEQSAIPLYFAMSLV